MLAQTQFTFATPRPLRREHPVPDVQSDGRSAGVFPRPLFAFGAPHLRAKDAPAGVVLNYAVISFVRTLRSCASGEVTLACNKWRQVIGKSVDFVMKFVSRLGAIAIFLLKFEDYDAQH